MLTGKQFDAYLKNRKFEPAGAGLAERIIAKAVVREYRPAVAERILEWIAERIRLQPVYSLLAVLMLGFLIGTALPLPGPHTNYAAIDEDEML